MTTHTRNGRSSRFKKSKKRPLRRKGATLVEFALVVPVLLSLLIGIMEFGWMVKNNLTVANATREGARAAALGKTTSEIQTRINNSMAPLSTSSGGSMAFKWSDNNGTDGYLYNVADSGAQNTVATGKLIKITVRCKHRPLTGFFPFMNNRFIESYATMRRE